MYPVFTQNTMSLPSVTRLLVCQIQPGRLRMEYGAAWAVASVTVFWLWLSRSPP